MQQLGYQAELIKLHSSGFGLGRTGWSTSLLQYLPICLLFTLHKTNKASGVISYIIILISIMISGSRGGFLYAMILTLLIINKVLSKKKVFSILILSILFFSTILNKPDFISFFRLDSNDITSGRGLQFLLVPKMIKQAGLFGLGIDGSYLFSSKYLIDHSLHNVYLRLIIDYGWILGAGIVAIVSIIVFRIFKTLHFMPYKDNEIIYISIFIIIGGLLAGMTEPGAIFEARSWWVIWWFALGIFSFNYKKIKDEKNRNNSN